MGIIIRKAFHNTAISYTGAVLGYVNFLLLLPYAFLPEQIGLVRVLQNAASLFVPLAQLGIISAVIRYFPYFKEDHQQKHSFFLYSLIITFVGFLLFTVAFLLFNDVLVDLYQEQSPMFVDFYHLILPLTFFLVFFSVLEAFANSNYKTAVPILLRDVLLRLLTTLLIIGFILEMISFTTFIYFLVGAYGIILLFVILYLFKINELKISFNFTFLKGGFFKEIFSYSLFVLLGSTGALFISYIDILMIGALIGLEPTGIYATAYYMAVVIDIPRRSIKQISDPFISQAIKNEDYDQIKSLYKKVSINQLIIGFLLILGIWCNIDEIFQIMPNGEIYEAGKYVVFLVMLAKLIDMSTSINGEIIGYSKYYRFNIFSLTILAILAVITNLIFIPKLGINGAALATLISLLLFNLIKYIFVVIKFKIHPFDINTLKIIIIAIATYGIVLLLPLSGNLIIDILIKSITVVIIFCSATIFLKVSEDFNKIIRKLFTKYF
ncbi:MAG: lipopolysaccharide biosynthesis protein [Candidatus Cyclobacteriaceae bacterium M2_1C_046]